MNDQTSYPQPPVASSGSTARTRKRNLWVTGAVLVLIVGGVAGAVWLSHRPPVNTRGGPGGPGRGGPGGRGGGGRGGRPQTTVGIATATEDDIPISIDGLGTVTPAAKVTVTPQVSGVITQILYKEGQTVKKGDTLAVIDPRPLQMALNQAQGQLARDEAQLTNAKLQLERDRTLLAQDSIARQDVDTQQALVGQLQGTVTADQASVGSAQLNLGFSRVVAPVSGKVGLRPIDLGNYINAGASTGVAVITQVTPIDVAFTIPQVDLPRVQTNAARCDLEVIALDQSKTNTLDTGVFSTLDNQIDTTTGTVKAKARFQNAKGNLFPNQFVNVRLNLEVLHNVVTVPVTAVRTGPQGDFVWVLQPDKTVLQRAVKRGPSTVDVTSITDGLDPGERVVTEGGDRLTDGARVQLPGDRPIPPGGARGGRRGGRGRRAGFGGAPGANGAGGQAGQYASQQGGNGGQAAGGNAGQGGGDQAGQGGGRRRGGGQGGQGFGGRQGGQSGGDQAGGFRRGGGQGGGDGQGGGFRRGAGGGQGGQFASGGRFGGRGGPGGRGGRDRGAAGAGGKGGAGCYTAPKTGNSGRGAPGQGRGGGRRGGGNGGNGGNFDAQAAQNQGRFGGRGGPNGQNGQGGGNRRGGAGGGSQDVTAPSAPNNGQGRRQRPDGRNGQGAGAGQGGGQSNGG